MLKKDETTSGHDVTECNDKIEQNENQSTIESEKKTNVNISEIKEKIEIISVCFSVIGVVSVIFMRYYQYQYCKDAEKFYNINGDLFITENTQMGLIPLFVFLAGIVFNLIIYYLGLNYKESNENSRDNAFYNKIIITAPFYCTSIMIYWLGLIFLISNCVIVIICLVLGIVILISPRWFYKEKNNQNKTKASKFRIIIALIMMILGCVFTTVTYIKDKNVINKKKYEIIKKGNTASCSTISNVEVVVLRKGSQIITQCGEMNGNDLTIYIDKYTIKESNNYEYTLNKFTNVVTNSNMPEQ